MRDARWCLPLFILVVAGCAAVEAEPAPVPPPPVVTPAPVFTPLSGTEVQRTLRDLGYQARRTDGVFDDETRHAVVAFQKVHGLPRTGVVDRATTDALRAPRTPSPRSPETGFEVDLATQVLHRIENGRVTRTYDASTGREPDQRTPTGQFRVQYQINGWRYAKLGPLYRPSYLTNTGIAVHGGEPVESLPASNGCVRLTDPAVDEVFGQLSPGTSVRVH